MEEEKPLFILIFNPEMGGGVESFSCYYLIWGVDDLTRRVGGSKLYIYKHIYEQN